MEITPTVQVTLLTVQQLVTAALDQLWYQQEGAEPGDSDYSCCPFCEARCAALLEFYMAGQLDELVMDHCRVDGNPWWSAEDGMVSYAFLDESWGWKMACCDESVGNDYGWERAPGNWVIRYNREYVERVTNRSAAGAGL